MKKYRVEIKYIHRCFVDIEAKDRRGAQALARKYVKNCRVEEFAEQDRVEHEIVVRDHPDAVECRVRETGLVIDPSDR